MGRTISLTEIAATIKAANVPAIVAQTGGGVATIFIGEPSENGDYPLVAGPGRFDESGKAVIEFNDFCFGREVDGEIESPSYITEGNETQITAMMLSAWNALDPKDAKR